MRVYHASPCIVKKPDTLHSREYLDFGKGFYVTELREQAKSYAKALTLRNNVAYVNEYELHEGKSDNYPAKRFDSYSEEWLDFVMRCRSGQDTSSWSMVIGGVADDKVFRTVDLYFAGDIGKDEALNRLKYESPNNQICLRTQQAIDELLTFINAEEAS